MNRRTAAGLILLAWVGALGWLAQREYGDRVTPEEASTRWPVPPGAGFLSVRMGERQVGLSSITVDTVGDSLRVLDLVTLDLPSDSAAPRRTSLRVVAVYSRALQLRRWQAELLTEHGRRSSTGIVSGDTLLTDISTGVGLEPDTVRLTLRRPVVLPAALPFVLTSRGLPRTGTKLNLEVYDPVDRELRLERLQVVAESLFTVPDSAEWSPTLRRWTVAHSDTVRAWRLDRDDRGLPVEHWVDAAGMAVRVAHPLGAVLDRSAFELVQTNFRALPRPWWDTSAAAPVLAPRDARPEGRPVLRAVAALHGGRPLPQVPPGLRGGVQAWFGDTVVAPAAGMGDDGVMGRPLADPLRADDGSLAAAAARVVGTERRPAVMARLLGEWVRRSITVEAGPALGPAVRTLARRRGSATERRVLLAALAEAAGLETRLVWGLVHGDGRWMPHAWLEVRAEGWVPVDPDGAQVLPVADRVRLAAGGEMRLLDVALRTGALRLSVLEDTP